MEQENLLLCEVKARLSGLRKFFAKLNYPPALFEKISSFIVWCLKLKIMNFKIAKFFFFKVRLI